VKEQKEEYPTLEPSPPVKEEVSAKAGGKGKGGRKKKGGAPMAAELKGGFF